MSCRCAGYSSLSVLPYSSHSMLLIPRGSTDFSRALLGAPGDRVSASRSPQGPLHFLQGKHAHINRAFPLYSHT